MKPSCKYLASMLLVFGNGLGSEAYAVNVFRSTAVKGGTTTGVGRATVAPMGRACGIIGNVSFNDPAAACANINGPVPPTRFINVTDGAGNHVDATSQELFAVGAFKAYRVSANDKSVTLPTFAFAEYLDPLVFSHPMGDAFSVSLVDSISGSNPSQPGLLLSADAGEIGSGSLHSDLSTDITGFLFSLDLSFKTDEPLSVNLNLGSYLFGLPSSAGWNKASIESSLRLALDADTPDNDFRLTSFDFPAIPIDVPAGSNLTVFTVDQAVAQAPEPGMLSLVGAGAVALLAVAGKRRNKPGSAR